MRGRGEVTNKEWDVLELLLRFERRANRQGHPPKVARDILNGVL